MLLMWLGPLVLMFFGLEIFRRAIGHLLSGFQKPFLRLVPEASTFKILGRTALMAWSQASVLKNQYGAAALLNLRRIFPRAGILLLCLANLGTWTSLLAAGLAWRVSGFPLLALAAIFFFTQFWFHKGLPWAQLLGGLGLFLIGAEESLRHQGILMSWLGESDFHFLLADGRWGAQLLWLATSFALTLLISLEAWSLFLSLLLVAAGSLSLNGAVALMLGEFLAHALRQAWRGSPRSASALKVNILALFVAFLLCGWMKELLSWNFELDLSQVAVRSWQVMLFYVAILAVQTFGLMIWGHFSFQQVEQNPMPTQQAKEYLLCWQQRGWVANSLQKFLR